MAHYRANKNMTNTTPHKTISPAMTDAALEAAQILAIRAHYIGTDAPGVSAFLDAIAGVLEAESAARLHGMAAATPTDLSRAQELIGRIKATGGPRA